MDAALYLNSSIALANTFEPSIIDNLKAVTKSFSDLAGYSWLDLLKSPDARKFAVSRSIPLNEISRVSTEANARVTSLMNLATSLKNDELSLVDRFNKSSQMFGIFTDLLDGYWDFLSDETKDKIKQSSLSLSSIGIIKYFLGGVFKSLILNREAKKFKHRSSTPSIFKYSLSDILSVNSNPELSKALNQSIDEYHKFINLINSKTSEDSDRDRSDRNLIINSWYRKIISKSSNKLTNEELLAYQNIESKIISGQIDGLIDIEIANDIAREVKVDRQTSFDDKSIYCVGEKSPEETAEELKKWEAFFQERRESWEKMTEQEQEESDKCFANIDRFLNESRGKS